MGRGLRRQGGLALSTIRGSWLDHTSLTALYEGGRTQGIAHLADAIHYGMVLMYIGQEIPKFPLADYTPRQHDRNHQIRAQYARGKTERELAETFGISHQRVSQILHGKRK